MGIYDFHCIFNFEEEPQKSSIMTVGMKVLYLESSTSGGRLSSNSIRPAQQLDMHYYGKP